LAKASANAYIQPPSIELEKLSSNPKNRLDKPVATFIDLGEVSQQKSSEIRKKQINRQIGKAMQVSFPREVLPAKDSASTNQLLQWSPTSEGGQITALTFRSGNAEGMRIGLVVQSLPPEAKIRFYANTSSTAVEASGKIVNDTLARNLSSGDSSEEGRTYWGPFLKGQNGTLEIELPVSVATSSIVIAIPNISHFFLDPIGKQSLKEASGGDVGFSPKSAGTCNLDVTCNVPLSTASNSVAIMDYIESGAGYVCTGTLLNDVDSTGTPYFLSADHCISTQTVASTLSTYWFYRSNGCNSDVLNPNFKERTGGAVLLYNRSLYSSNPEFNQGTDTSFMRLNSIPPAGAVFSGWNADSQVVSKAISYTALHHPDGNLQKYSLGKITGFAYYDRFGNGYSNTVNTLYGLYRVNWSAGVTEGGSSGSGLFLDANSSNPKLVGQLFGGESSCALPAAADYYGRFDIAYQQSLAKWLSPYSQAVYRFYNTSSGSYFYTISNVEVQNIRQSYLQFILEGSAYFASPIAGSSLMPVYRFRNKLNGSYLWTIYQSERNSINQNFSTTFIEEGVAWYARQTLAAGYVPLYRFRDFTNGTYFYTASEAEKNSLLVNYVNRFTLEGPAYYVKSSL
jgi:lysyl endopeptidase